MKARQLDNQRDVKQAGKEDRKSWEKPTLVDLITRHTSNGSGFYTDGAGSTTTTS